MLFAAGDQYPQTKPWGLKVRSFALGAPEVPRSRSPPLYLQGQESSRHLHKKRPQGATLKGQ